MKEEKDVPEGEESEEPGIEAIAEPGIEAVEEQKVDAVPGQEATVDEEESVSVGEEAEAEQADESRPREDEETEGEGDTREPTEDGIELDRMEVQPTAESEEELPEVPEKTEDEQTEPPVSEEGEPERPGLLTLLIDHWMWIAGGLLVLLLSSAIFLFVMTPQEEAAVEVVARSRVQAVTASLGGEHYVRFNLWGPFRDPKGEEALRRGLPKVKHALILSGGFPEVARSIQENDLYFLEKHILQVVSNATGIPVDKLDLKGLSITRYSDEAEVGGDD
jgi:hypothetical protein